MTDYDITRDGPASYEVGVQTAGRDIKAGFCARRDGRCWLCGRGVCVHEKEAKDDR